MENAVDSFCNNCLLNYFTQARVYSIELEQRLLEGVVTQRNDCIISFQKITSKLNALIECDDCI